MTATTPVLESVRRRPVSFRRLGRGGAVIGAANVVSGVAAYLFLVLAARKLSPVADSELSSLWTLLFLLGPGCFAPVEQEACRLAVARISTGSGDRAAIVRAAQVGVAILTLVVAGLAVSYIPLRSRVFGGHGFLVAVLALGLVAFLAMYLTCGVLASRRRFRGYAVVAGAEGLVRLLLCVLLVLELGWSVTSFGLAVAVAPIIATYLGWRSDGFTLERGPAEPLGRVAKAIAFLLGASLLRLAILMVGPVVVQVLANASQRAEAGRFLAALALTRVPLFLFNAALVALLPKLSGLVAQQRRSQYVTVVVQVSAAVAVLAAAGAGAVALVGPSVLRMVFGNAYVLPAAQLVLLTVGCGLYMLAVALSYGLISLGQHRSTTISWLLGCMALAVVVAAGTGLGLLGRVEWALVAGSTASTLMMALYLRRFTRLDRWAG